MSPSPPPTVVTTWFGTFVQPADGPMVEKPYPTDREAIRERLRQRREGRATAEEHALLESLRPGGARGRDRRLEPLGLKVTPVREPRLDPRRFGHDPEAFRELLLAEVLEDIRREWDPTVHLQEATRALTELDETLNLLGERLSSWADQERPAEAPDGPAHRPLARALAAPAAEPEAEGGLPADPALERARRELAELYLAVDSTHAALERSLEEAVPVRAPNLHALLGASLAARLISQAGSLERLARLPASTVQVLGAERAFFEHLRGRAPPPRHGLLFLHPALHSAPRAQRGRLARALAGAVSIAARLDRAGRPVDPSLGARFATRSEEIRRPRKGSDRGPPSVPSDSS